MEYTTKKEEVFKLLRDCEWHSNAELDKNSSWRFGASICTLRDEGYRIETRFVQGKKTKCEYRMLSTEPDAAYAAERAATEGEYHAPKDSTLRNTIAQLRAENRELRKKLEKYEIQTQESKTGVDTDTGRGVVLAQQRSPQ